MERGRGSGHYLCPMPKQFAFPKTERLKSRKQIDDLFAARKGFAVFPVRVLYQFLPAGEFSGLQVGVSASKRQFKKAVDRNRLKRLLREAYRLQKGDLQQQVKEAGLHGVVFFLYTDKTMASFETIQTAMAKCLKKLSAIAQHENLS